MRLSYKRQLRKDFHVLAISYLVWMTMMAQKDYLILGAGLGAKLHREAPHSEYDFHISLLILKKKLRFIAFRYSSLPNML